MDIRWARLHEAGHLLAPRLLGQPDSPYVTLWTDGSGGECGHGEPPVPPRDMSRRDWLEWRTFSAVGDLCGQAALEALGYPGDPAEGAGWDRGLARDDAIAMDPAHVDLWMARFYRTALALCRDHRAALERLADTLAANDDRLAGPDEIGRAIDAALADSPTPILTGLRPISQAVFSDRLRTANRQRK